MKHDKGPWTMTIDDWGDGKIVIQSQDFTHDVALSISGDFESLDQKIEYAEELCGILNKDSKP